MISATPLVVRDLRKSYASLEVLKGVSLTASKGDVVAIIGGSGSGKSTFLRCINFLETPSAGEISLFGEPVRLKHTARGAEPADKAQLRRMRTRVGMVFQNFNLWPHMTVLQNVIEASIHVLKRPRAETAEKGMALLERVGLADKHGHYPTQLSGGQQQRVAIARTLCVDPELLLFDEPTSALDPELVGEVLRVMRMLAEEGRTMIVVTHEMAFAREVSSKVMFFSQGLVEEEGAPAELFGAPRSERLAQFLARVSA